MGGSSKTGVYTCLRHLQKSKLRSERSTGVFPSAWFAEVVEQRENQDGENSIDGGGDPKLCAQNGFGLAQEPAAREDIDSLVKKIEADGQAEPTDRVFHVNPRAE